MKKSRLFGAVCVCIFMLGAYTSVKATTVKYVGSQISGVFGLEFQGILWDVSFESGSEDTVYADVDVPYPFISVVASNAAIHLFSTLKALTPSALATDFVGCYGGTPQCYIMTPYESGVGWASNWPNDGETPTHLAYNHWGDFANLTFSVWEPAAVPIPSTVLLFGSGLLGLVSMARRKKAV